MWIEAPRQPITRRTFEIVASVIALAIAGTTARGQDAPAWTFSASLGGFVKGNKSAITGWLKTNGFGAQDPGRCGFNPLFEKTCSGTDAYPKVSGLDLVGWTFSVRHPVTERASLELAVATEQGGTIVGRCDGQAMPRNIACTEQFLTLDIGGASFAALGVWDRGPVHLGVGPAILLANWRMEPSHLPGVWADATVGAQRFPLFARIQYRFYKSARLDEQGFTTFHPSTLLIGGGVSLNLDNGPP